MSGERSGPADHTDAEPVEEPVDETERATAAARTALQRARADAAARGRRPGGRGPSRTVPVGGPAAHRDDDRDPQVLGSGLERLITERGWQVDVAVGGVMGRWSRIVGSEMAGHCTPQTFGDGVLVVQADSTAWATQVRLLAPTLLRRLAEELGDGVVQNVRVHGPAAPSWRKGHRTVRGQGPRDTYG